MVLTKPQKVAECRVRRLAARAGFALVRCKARDRAARGFGLYVLIDLAEPDRTRVAAEKFINREGRTLHGIEVKLRLAEAEPVPQGQERTAQAMLSVLRGHEEDPEPVVLRFHGVPMLGGRPLSAGERAAYIAELERKLAACRVHGKPVEVG